LIIIDQFLPLLAFKCSACY